MLLNEISDDCLLTIFNYLNSLNDLINCYQVCIRWSYLITKRTRRVKYLIEDDPIESFDHVNHYGKKPNDGVVLSSLFGNLKIFEFTPGLSEKFKLEDIAELLVKNQRSIKGLIYHCDHFSLESLPIIAQYYDQPEMIYTDYIEKSISQKGFSVKQLTLWNYTMDYFEEVANNFPNLERLNLQNSTAENSYRGPVMEKLKIVELELFCGREQTNYCFQFMDSCPNLQSAHLYLTFYSLVIDESIKNRGLQDLVIFFDTEFELDFDEIKSLMMKYPNLKHLSLRNTGYGIADSDIEKLIKILPNLVLFDVSDCLGVTQSAAEYVKRYCERHGRSIKFYFADNAYEMHLDWSHLSERKETISRGFDFMKNCFMKEFGVLPAFLIPNDY